MLKHSQINFFSLTILFLGIFSFVTFVHAQTPQEIINNIQNNIQVSITPQYPKAGDTVNIHLVSYSTPLDEATISWIVGGKVINKAFGLTDFSTIAGKVGSKSTIIARVVTANGSAIDKTIIIQPADVDLLWQASSYVPPFYQGKALYPHQGVIIFTAVPSVSASKSIVSSANSYVYTWKKDGDTLGDYSGFGKNTFALQGTIISRPFTIEVSISSTDGVSLGAASVTINPRSPQIAFYENNPLLGVLYNKNISSFTMQGKELSVTAVPFFFNTQPAGNLQFAWTMNNSPIASQSDPSALTVRNTTDAKGSATVGVQISNVIKTLQFAGRSMSVTFGDNQTSI